MSDVPILAINSGSSTLKFGLFSLENGEERPLLRGSAEGIGKDGGKLEVFDGAGKLLHHEDRKYASQREALEHLTETLNQLHEPKPGAVGHRVVHGGAKLRDHARIDDKVLATLDAAVHFAPLHIPTSIELIRAAQSVYPGIPQFACFDTAFHQTMPEEAWHYPLPETFVTEGVRRYGFHGLSYASIVHTLGGALKPRAVIAHLGNGASLCAVRDGKSVDTSMGMTPTGGIPMGTRTGDLDPGVLLYLMRVHHLDDQALESLLNHDSGLKALGGDSDMRKLDEAAGKGSHEAALAIEIFCRAVARTVAAFAVSLGGLDQLIFAGGIGEHSASVRANVADKLAWLGVQLDDARNRDAAKVISEEGEPIEVLIVGSEEEAQIAREVRRLL
ncbi:acetate/propionate family kinase [Silvibacterium dinghuense]|uniref:Acetate kinase n=1 Tax=Silvibacterium dinghuense TaxID=1560006 RepID=A0A4Q1SH86_9BACT|nr:acetate/propionate family kinase [Silvibacterium dinghuense]RXS96717.1 acetate/propionate family kinase [Silvibacterium dinghuense]GGG93080.1 acetate kinase [Silvibacterium dinghuense]